MRNDDADEFQAVAPSEPPPSPWYKDPVGAVKRWMGGAKMDKKQLAALGGYTLINYPPTLCHSRSLTIAVTWLGTHRRERALLVRSGLEPELLRVDDRGLRHLRQEERRLALRQRAGKGQHKVPESC